MDGGDGRVFPKRSPLLPDVSQAVLNITGGETILNLENAWFKKDGNCEDASNPQVSSNKLDFRDFRVLFLTTLVASGLALIIYVVRFSYRSNQQPGVVAATPNNNSLESPELIQNSNHANSNYVSTDSDSDSGEQRSSTESATEVLLVSNH
ncbi:hypothetical protein ACLB2K_009589 [Fragaria x ananassa]